MTRGTPASRAAAPDESCPISNNLTAAAIRKAGLSRIGLLGTRFTMEQDFYRGRLVERHGIDVLTPEADDRALVPRVIYEELCLGRIEERSRKAYLDVMQRLVERGAQGIILGCTEISMLVGEQDASVPLFDTTAIHAAAAAELALAAVDSATPRAHM